MTLTQIIILIIFAMIIVIDIILYLSLGDDATISRTLLRLAQEWPIVAIIFGILIGHVFWTNCGGDNGTQSSLCQARSH